MVESRYERLRTPPTDQGGGFGVVPQAYVTFILPLALIGICALEAHVHTLQLQPLSYHMDWLRYFVLIWGKHFRCS